MVAPVSVRKECSLYVKAYNVLPAHALLKLPVEVQSVARERVKDNISRGVLQREVAERISHIFAPLLALLRKETTQGEFH